MQREARRVQEENIMLRELLRAQGMSHDAVQNAISSMKVQMAAGKPPSQPEVRTSRQVSFTRLTTQQPNNKITTCAADSNNVPEQWSSSSNGIAPVTSVTPSELDAAQSLDLNEWLNDLCDIKNAFELEASVSPSYLQEATDGVQLTCDLMKAWQSEQGETGETDYQVPHPHDTMP